MEASAAKIQVKVLVLDADQAAAEQVRAFCETHDLVPVKVPADNLMPVAAFQHRPGRGVPAEGFESHSLSGMRLAQELNRIRPELPIFMRTAAPHTLSESERRFVRHAYHLGELAGMAEAVGNRCSVSSTRSRWCAAFPT
jgi:hypothetical protein